MKTLLSSLSLITLLSLTQQAYAERQLADFNCKNNKYKLYENKLLITSQGTTEEVKPTEIHFAAKGTAFAGQPDTYVVRYQSSYPWDKDSITYKKLILVKGGQVQYESANINKKTGLGYVNQIEYSCSNRGFLKP